MEFVKRDITRQNRNGEITAIGGGNSGYKSSNGSISGGNAVSGDYLPATSNGDGTYTINLDRVFLTGNFIAQGDISSYGQGVLDNGNVVTVYDGLDSTDPAVALSANQGRVLKELIQNIDLTGVDIDLTNIYTKEVADKTFATISNFNSHTTNSNIHITDTQKSNWNSAYSLAHGHDNKEVLDGISATNVSNWNTVYKNWNNVFNIDSNGDLKVKVNVIGEKDIIAYGSSASGSGGSIDIINALNSDRTDAALSAYQGKVLKGLIDSFDFSAIDGTITYKGVVNISSSNSNAKSVIDNIANSLTDGGAALCLVGDSNGSTVLTTQKYITVHSSLCKSTSYFLTTDSVQINVGDFILISKQKYLGVSTVVLKIVPLNDCKASSTTGGVGTNGVMTPWDKERINKVDGIEWTANHVRDNYLPKSDLFPSKWESNMNNCLSTGVYPWCTLGRPSGATGAFTCLVNRTSTNDGSYDTIEQTAYGREGELGQIWKRIIFYKSDGTDTQYGDWRRIDNEHSHSNQTTLDKITSTHYTNWNDANSKKHEHSNKSVLDGITSTKVSNWDTVYSNWNNVFTIDNNGNLKIKVNVIGEGDISAYGAGTSSGGGSITIIDALTSTETGCALSANQGRILKQLIDNIDVNAVDLSNYFTKNEINTKLASKADSHTHPYASSTHTHNDTYYTESEIDTKLSGKSDTTHTHNYASTVKIGTTSYTSSSNTVSLPAYPTLSSLGAASSSHTHTDYMPKSGGTFTNTVYVTKDKSLFFAKDTDGIYITNASIQYHNSSNAWTSSLLSFSSDLTTVKSKLTCEKAATFTTSGTTVVCNRTGGGHPYVLFQSDGTALGDFGFNASTKKPIVYDYNKSKWVDVYTETNSDSLPLSFNNAANLSAKGWYRFATATRADNTGGNCLFFITRTYNNTNNESYIVAANITFNQCTFTQLAGKANTQLITEIRCTFENNGTMYFDLYYNGTVNNQVFVNCVGHAKTQTPTATTTTLTKVNTFTLTDGMKHYNGTTYPITIIRNATTGGAYVRYGANNQIAKSWAAGSDSSNDFAWYYKDTDAGTDVVKLKVTKAGTLSSDYWYLNNSASNPYLKLTHTYNSANTVWYCQADNGYMYLGNGSSKSFRIDTSGNCLSVGELTAYSDKRLKSDIKPLEVRGELNPVTYKKDGKDSIGFIADEVKELYPELVNTDESSDEKYLTLNYSQLTAVLYAEIKELKKQITELKEKLI